MISVRRKSMYSNRSTTGKRKKVDEWLTQCGKLTYTDQSINLFGALPAHPRVRRHLITSKKLGKKETMKMDKIARKHEYGVRAVRINPRLPKVILGSDGEHSIIAWSHIQACTRCWLCLL